LHAVDQGIAADWLGSLFTILLGKMPGQTQSAKCSSLFRLVQEFYRESNTQSRLDNLTLSMLAKPNSTPKLRSKAAEARALIPFALAAAQKLLDRGDAVEEAIITATSSLASCYQCLSHDSYEPAVMREACKAFCLQLVALETRLPRVFRVKPKLHLFQELCEMSHNNPSMTWNYRDEEFGGSVSALGKRRGGANTAVSTAMNTLNRFRASFSFPRLS
jgi:hypothetical protein